MASGAVFANGDGQVSATSNKYLDPDDHETVSTYYGSEASKSLVNPCKGPVVRVCATVVTHLSLYRDNQTLVRQEVKDELGKVLSTTSYIYPASIEKTKADIKLETIKQGGEFEEIVGPEEIEEIGIE